MHRRQLIKSAVGVSALSVGGCAMGIMAAAEPADRFEQAFFFAFPLYEFARIEQERTGSVGGLPGRLNTIVHRSQLLDHTSRQVTAPNNDTIYSSIFLELSGGPVELNVPSSSNRYFSLAFMHAFTDVFAYVGTRATRGLGGRVWIVGPQWEGQAPYDVQLVRSPSNDAWVLMRTLVDGPQDLPMAQAFQAELTLTVSPGRPAARGFHAAAGDVSDPAAFLSLVNEVISRSPGGSAQFGRAPQFAAQGVGMTNLPPQGVLDRWRTTIPGALETLRETFKFRDYVVDGWSYQPAGINDFGTNDRLRAAVALGGIAGNREEEAMYFHADFSADNAPLTGSSRYCWRVPPGGVPVDAFWSLTMYEVTPEGRSFFIENPINRYSVGDRTPGLIVDADGGFEILIQRDRPSGPLAANWLPAPAGRMRLVLRAYLPKQQLRDRSWKVPTLRLQG